MRRPTVSIRQGCRARPTVLRRWCALALILILLLACGGPRDSRVQDKSGDAEAYTGTLLDPPKDLTPFTLTSHTGAPWKVHDLQGRPALVTFGYTACPDYCPTTLGVWKQVHAALGAAAANVAFVWITVDPQRDTPAVLAPYLAQFNPQFIGLTGDHETIAAIGTEFGIEVHEAHTTHAGDDTASTVDHATYAFLVNRAGQLHKVYGDGVSAEVLAHDLQQLLRDSTGASVPRPQVAP